MEWVQVASTFGFPAFMAVLLFVTYKELVRQVVEVVKANTESARALADSHRALCHRMEAMERLVGRRSGDQ